jgi:CRP/FNR family cyclic AMP-dependent transcriptional regulator
MPMAPKPSNVLSGLPKRLLSELFGYAVAHRLRDGEVLFRAGDLGDGCYQIQTGLVKVVVASKQGDERIISLLGPDAIVGELSMIDGGPRSASVIAIADCSLSFLSRAKFQTCIDSRPELTQFLVKTLALRLREADNSLAATTFLSVKGRLARALLNLAEYVGESKGGGRIELRLKISQGDLAAMAGVARENVSRTMSEWRKRDVVTRSSNYYCINNPTALARDMESETSWLVATGGERNSSAVSLDPASTAQGERPEQ